MKKETDELGSPPLQKKVHLRVVLTSTATSRGLEHKNFIAAILARAFVEYMTVSFPLEQSLKITLELLKRFHLLLSLLNFKIGQGSLASIGLLLADAYILTSHRFQLIIISRHVQIIRDTILLRATYNLLEKCEEGAGLGIFDACSRIENENIIWWSDVIITRHNTFLEKWKPWKLINTVLCNELLYIDIKIRDLSSDLR